MLPPLIGLNLISFLTHFEDHHLLSCYIWGAYLLYILENSVMMSSWYVLAGSHSFHGYLVLIGVVVCTAVAFLVDFLVISWFEPERLYGEGHWCRKRIQNRQLRCGSFIESTSNSCKQPDDCVESTDQGQWGKTTGENV